MSPWVTKARRSFFFFGLTVALVLFAYLLEQRSSWAWLRFLLGVGAVLAFYLGLGRGVAFNLLKAIGPSLLALVLLYFVALPRNRRPPGRPAGGGSLPLGGYPGPAPFQPGAWGGGPGQAHLRVSVPPLAWGALAWIGNGSRWAGERVLNPFPRRPSRPGKEGLSGPG
jgi:hypothetical protein